MPATGQIRAGRAFVELFADDSKLVRGLKRAEQKLKAFGAGVRNLGLKVMAVGGAAALGLGAAVKAFSSTGDSLAKMSQRTGISVESLSELGYAAEQSGTDMETLEAGVRNMQRSITDAARGSSEAQESLDNLGLSVEQLQGLSPEEQFKLIADRLSKIEDPSTRAAMAMKLLGRSGTQLLPLMQNGAKGIEELQARARELGLTISGEDAAAAVVFGDTLDDLIKVVRRGVFAIGSALAPVLTDLIARVTRVAVSVVDWIKRNRQLVVNVAKVVVGVLAAGAALVILGTGISVLGGVFGAVATVIGGVGAAFGVIGSILAAIVSPIGLVITAVVALGAILIYVSGAGGKALEWLRDRFLGLKNDAQAAFGGIADALAAGDIALAVKILWLLIRLEWVKGTNFIKQKWIDFKQFFIEVANNAFAGALAAWQIIQNGLVVAWIETTAFLERVWTNFVANFRGAWGGAINWTQKRLLELMGLFDKNLDVNAAKEMADKDLAAANAKIDQEREKALGENEQQRATARQIADKEHEDRLNQIATQNKKDNDAASAQFNAERQQAEAAVEQARQEFADAVAEAARKRKDLEVKGPPQAPKPPEVDAGVDFAKKKVDVRGTFNAAAIQGLLTSGGAQERTAKATEETAKNTKTIIRELRDDLAFA